MIDTSRFQLYPHLEGNDEEETQLLMQMAENVLRCFPNVKGVPPVEKLYLAFAIPEVIALFLAQLEGTVADHPNEREMWGIVGDMPEAFIGAEGGHDPAEILTRYCDLMQEWADRILAGKDLAGCYSIHAEPTPEHARALKGRLKTIRKNFIPLVRRGEIVVS